MESKRTEKEWKIKREKMNGRKLEKKRGWLVQCTIRAIIDESVGDSS
jgi:hypothetical protein